MERKKSFGSCFYESLWGFYVWCAHIRFLIISFFIKFRLQLNMVGQSTWWCWERKTVNKQYSIIFNNDIIYSPFITTWQYQPWPVIISEYSSSSSLSCCAHILCYLMICWVIEAICQEDEKLTYWSQCRRIWPSPLTWNATNRRWGNSARGLV